MCKTMDGETQAIRVDCTFPSRTGASSAITRVYVLSHVSNGVISVLSDHEMTEDPLLQDNEEQRKTQTLL